MSMFIDARTEALTFASDRPLFAYLVIGRQWGNDDDSADLIAADNQTEALEAHAALLGVELAGDDPGPGQYVHVEARLIGTVHTSPPTVPVVGSVC